MFDIGLPEIICTNKLVDSDNRAIKYEAEAKERPIQCRNESCRHKIKPHIHSTNKNLLHDVKSEGKLVYIDLIVRRYRCPDCGYVFPDEFSFYEKNSHITNRLKQEFIARCIKGETFTYIADDYGMDHKTVANIFKEYSSNHTDKVACDYTPEVLGLDEAHIDEHFRLVITDILNHRLLDMKKDNKTATVMAYLKTLDKKICKCVTMDFCRTYSSCVEKVLPDAFIVIDKFHAIQEVNKCLDKTRIALQNKYKSEGVSTKRFKKIKYLFTKNWEDLTSEEYDIVNSWLMQFTDLYYAYMTKESFRDIYLTSKSYEDAEEKFDKWIKTIPDFETFKPMKRTMIQRKQHILNYWNAPFTNAYTESVNNQIKRIEKAGRGYKFTTLRERCLLEINTPKPDRFDVKTANFTSVSDETIDIRKRRCEGLYKVSKAVKSTAPNPNIQKSEYTYDIILNGALNVYLEYFNQEREFCSRDLRFQAYIRALQKL